MVIFLDLIRRSLRFTPYCLSAKTANSRPRSWTCDTGKRQRFAWKRLHPTSCRPFVAQIVFFWSEADQTRHAI